jgi:hypothetical protein
MRAGIVLRAAHVSSSRSVQYLDTIKDSTSHGNSTLFLPGNPGGLNDMQSQVRTGLLEASWGSKKAKGR